VKYIIYDRFENKNIGWVSKTSFKLPKKIGLAWRKVLKEKQVLEKLVGVKEGVFLDLVFPYYLKQGFKKFLFLFLEEYGAVFRVRE